MPGGTLRPDLEAGDRAKAFFDGTHRTVSPAETIRRARPHFKAMGLTRVGDLTRLDRVGLPTAQAVRPAARSLSVNQGKGTTRAAARASAIMESLETWAAEKPLLSAVHGARTALMASVDCADLAGLSCRSDITTAQMNSTNMDWFSGWNLMTDAPILVPFDCVQMDYTRRQQTSFIHRTSNGLASGNTLAEATAAALFEVIERDANADFEALAEADKRRRRIARSSLDQATARPIIDRITRAGLWLDVWDMTNDLDVPTYYAIVYECRDDRRGGIQRPFAGAGSHLDADVALSRAVTEALQSRLTVISGARDDLDGTDYEPAPGSMLPVLAATMFEDAAQASFVPRNDSGTSSRVDIDILLDRLRRAGLDQTALVDLTRPDMGIPVVRVVAPGLGLPVGKGNYRRGTRHKTATPPPDR